MDGVEKSLSQLKEIEISNVQRLDFYVGEDIDILIASLLELDKYIDNVGSALLEETPYSKESHDLKKDSIGFRLFLAPQRLFFVWIIHALSPRLR